MKTIPKWTKRITVIYQSKIWDGQKQGELIFPAFWFWWWKGMSAGWTRGGKLTEKPNRTPKHSETSWRENWPQAFSVFQAPADCSGDDLYDQCYRGLQPADWGERQGAVPGDTALCKMLLFCAVSCNGHYAQMARKAQGWYEIHNQLSVFPESLFYGYASHEINSKFTQVLKKELMSKHISSWENLFDILLFLIFENTQNLKRCPDKLS